MRCLALCLVSILPIPAAAQTAFPSISHVHPVAVQRGQTSVLTVEGQGNFAGAYQVLFDIPGVKAEVLPDKAPAVPPPQKPLVRKVKLAVQVDPDARLGVREFRVATLQSVSSIGQIVVVDDPVIEEKNPDNSPAEAQPLELPCVVAGKLEAPEDVDFFQFQAGKGETVTFEMLCARLEDKVADLQKHAKPMLTLYDEAGNELASNDHFFFADPLLSFTIPEAGTYRLQVRDSTYDGDGRWVYALFATKGPYASHVYPMAGKAGEKISVAPIGPAARLAKNVAFEVPANPGLQKVQLTIGAEKTNPISFFVSTFPQVLEAEPNDEPAKGTKVSLPAGINGRIDRPRDLDHYVFTAQKGQPLRFELKARRFGTLLSSSLHGVLEVMDGTGTVLAFSDVSHGNQEAALVFTPKLDGDYGLRVRDLAGQGGASFVYHVEAEAAQPGFTLRCDPDKMMLCPGGSMAWYVHVNRVNGFTGPVAVTVKGLPQGVSASPLVIAPTLTQGVLVLTASPKAALGTVANVEVAGSAAIKTADGEKTLVRTAVANQETYLGGGGRGRFDVNMQTVAVTQPADVLKVDVSSKEVILRPGEEAKIDVDVLRGPDYDKNVTLSVALEHGGTKIGDPLPPGVSLAPGLSTTFLGTESKGTIVLKADAKAAPIERVPISILCHVSINFVVKVSYSSPVIWVTVRD